MAQLLTLKMPKRGPVINFAAYIIYIYRERALARKQVFSGAIALSTTVGKHRKCAMLFLSTVVASAVAVPPMRIQDPDSTPDPNVLMIFHLILGGEVNP